MVTGIEMDCERASIVRQVFEMYATGAHSLLEIARWAALQGFTMPRSAYGAGGALVVAPTGFEPVLPA